MQCDGLHGQRQRVGAGDAARALELLEQLDHAAEVPGPGGEDDPGLEQVPVPREVGGRQLAGAPRRAVGVEGQVRLPADRVGALEQLLGQHRACALRRRCVLVLAGARLEALEAFVQELGGAAEVPAALEARGAPGQRLQELGGVGGEELLRHGELAL